MSNNKKMMILMGLVSMALAVELGQAVITVQIGGASRLSSLTRQRDRYNCYWDCDLVGCQIARDDDECAYDCEKICRIRYDYAGRSGGQTAAAAAADQLGPKSGAPVAQGAEEQLPAELLGGKYSADATAINQALAHSTRAQLTSDLLAAPRATIAAGQSVRLHLPRNASAPNFAIWERCSADTNTGKLTEKPFSL